MNRLRCTGAFALLVLLSIACAAPTRMPAQEQPDEGQRSTTTPKRASAVIFSAPVNLNGPITWGTAGSARGQDAVIQLVSSGLTQIDNVGQTHPVLAEAVPTVDNGQWLLLPDGRMQLTFKMRSNARWHDGTPISAADVVFADQLRKDRELAVFGFNAFVPIESVEAVDSATVRMTWTRPYIYADLAYGYSTATSPLPLPVHLLQKPYLDDKARFLDLSFWSTDFVGSGPYRLREFAVSSHVLLDANDAYVLGRPKIDQLEVKFIPDSNTVIANLLAGTVDVTLGASFSLENGRQILDRMPGAGMYLAPRGAINAFPQFLNTDPPIVLNLQFRRALLHAADRQAMVDNLMFGQTDIAHSFVNPVEAVYQSVESSIVRYDYDQRRAGELVESLGYTRGGDGMFRNPAGQTIQLRVDVQGGRGDPTEKAALALVDNWRQVGVDAEVFVIPTALQDNAEFRSTFPAFDLARRGNYRFSLYSVLGSTEAPLPENRFRGGNRGRYMSADLDGLIERHDGSISERDRNALLAQIVRHVTDQAVLVGLFFDLDATVHSERMQNITGFAERTTQAWNAHLWDVK